MVSTKDNRKPETTCRAYLRQVAGNPPMMVTVECGRPLPCEVHAGPPAISTYAPTSRTREVDGDHPRHVQHGTAP